MKKILVVDDSPVILAATAHALREAGYDVHTRAGVEELVGKGTEGFDLILLDVQMPQLFGDDVGAVLRLERAVRTPIYLFSTLPAEDLQERVREARLDGFIAKGAGLDHVIAEVRRILS
jgi:CheY-like chemotaxis protein